MITTRLTIGGPDLQPPVISSVAAHPDELWPPDGRLHEVRVSYAVSDDVDPVSALSCSLSVGGIGESDAEILSDHAVRLRATRRGQAPSDYAVTVSCADRAGNVGTRTIHVPVARENEGRDGRDR